MSEYKNPVCRGSWALGTACGSCERCRETSPIQNAKPQTFPKITRLGLEVRQFANIPISRRHLTGEDPLPSTDDFVRAEELEAVLAKGVRVYGTDPERACIFERSNLYPEDTHTALLIAIEPIKRETAEDVLREIVELIEGNVKSPIYEDKLLERAKRVLSKP